MQADRASVLRPLGDLEPAERPDDELQAVIRRDAGEMAAHEAGAKSGADPEDLHKLRVATRRIRSLLRSTRTLVEDRDEAESLRAELKWLATLLGEVRDRDVLIEYLLGELETLDGAPLGAVLELIDGEREVARREVVRGLDAARYAALTARLETPPALRAGKTLREAAEGDYRRLRRTMRKLGTDSSDAELHEARIRAKRARYAVEAAGLGSAFADRAKALQDVLGEHQDAVVAEVRIRALLEQVHGAGRTAFAVGRLVERQHARRAAARHEWPEAWRRLEKAGTRIF
ncbi:MAG TPA: CHAD domain-containing protein [Gaiellaceae bacterium]|nr:CHAD domain-containing protein [Gaiellaceae bacterium]